MGTAIQFARQYSALFNQVPLYECTYRGPTLTCAIVIRLVIQIILYHYCYVMPCMVLCLSYNSLCRYTNIQRSYRGSYTTIPQYAGSHGITGIITIHYTTVLQSTTHSVRSPGRVQLRQRECDGGKKELCGLPSQAGPTTADEPGLHLPPHQPVCRGCSQGATSESGSAVGGHLLPLLLQVIS